MWSALLSVALTVKVMGVIAGDANGVALIQQSPGAPTVAVRAGTEISPAVVIDQIERDFVYVRIEGRPHKVRVGEDLASAEAQSGVWGVDPSFKGGGEIERQGQTVRISSGYRDHLIKRELSKVLMQVAAVPYYVNGELKGFKLLDIDAGSVFQQAGFQDGDIVTAINGNELRDVGMTIRLLQSLREEARVEVGYLRGGAEQKLALEVQ